MNKMLPTPAMPIKHTNLCQIKKENPHAVTVSVSVCVRAHVHPSFATRDALFEALGNGS